MTTRLKSGVLWLTEFWTSSDLAIFHGFPPNVPIIIQGNTVRVAAVNVGCIFSILPQCLLDSPRVDTFNGLEGFELKMPRHFDGYEGSEEKEWAGYLCRLWKATPALRPPHFLLQRMQKAYSWEKILRFSIYFETC